MKSLSYIVKTPMEAFEFDSEEMSWIARLDQLKTDFGDLEKITDKWGFLRQIYMESLPMIMERAKVDIVSPINPYPVDWSQYFSPIEEQAWHSIRGHHMALYPQFPVFNHFIDFANPYLRIGLEMDGKQFHDPVKDAIRDEMLWKYGWRIFRIKGAECFVPFKNLDEIQYEYHDIHQDKQRRDDDIHHWITNTADGVIYAMKQMYFLKDLDKYSNLYHSCLFSLDDHKGADFYIDE